MAPLPSAGKGKSISSTDRPKLGSHRIRLFSKRLERTLARGAGETEPLLQSEPLHDLRRRDDLSDMPLRVLGGVDQQSNDGRG